MNMSAFGRIGRGLWAGLALAMIATQGRAEFAVCNQSLDVINVAIAQYDYDTFVTEGWWTVGPNQCANVIDEELPSRYVYVFAQDVFGNTVLNGTTPLCVNTKRFRIQSQEDCLIQGYLEAKFLEVDTRNAKRWTLLLTP